MHARLRISLIKAGSFTALAGESLAYAFWGLLYWFALFAGLWTLDVQNSFPPWSNPATALIFWAGSLVLLMRGASRVRLPAREAVERAIERESNVHHRPFQQVDDQPVIQTEHELWLRGLAQARKALASLRTVPPRIRIANRDPAGLRVIALLILVIGLTVAGPVGRERIVHGIFPFTSPTFMEKYPVLVRVFPPAYTGLPEIVLNNLAQPVKTTVIPSGSRVEAFAKGWVGAPGLTMGDITVDLKSLGSGGYKTTIEAVPGDRIAITQLGLTRATWPYEYKPDAPPRIAELTPIEILNRGEIRLHLRAGDDYGLKSLTLSVTKKGGQPDETQTVARAVMTPAGKDTELHPVFDLTSTIWAGLPVMLTATVTDAIGQQTSTPAVEINLPERKFTHPVAVEISALRRELGRHGYNAAPDIAAGLQMLKTQPDRFGNDLVAWLSLDLAADRLMLNDDRASLMTVFNLLWETALRIEEGQISLAARQLETSRENLMAALENGQVSEEELLQLMDRFRQAMADYFQELAREMRKEMARNENMPPMPPEMFERSIDTQALSDFMRDLQQQLLQGNRQKVQEMLSQLQQLTDMLNSGRRAEMPKDVQQMMQGMNDMRDLIRAQKTLLESTRDDNRRTQPLAEEQEKLRQSLGDIMAKIQGASGNIPDPLSNAESAMYASSQSLKDGERESAAAHQQIALDELQKGANQMGQALKERLKSAGAMSLGTPSSPFGRRAGKSSSGTEKLPEEAERRQVEDILELLRKRSGELTRPEYEIEYYKRLLKRF